MTTSFVQAFCAVEIHFTVNSGESRICLRFTDPLWAGTNLDDHVTPFLGKVYSGIYVLLPLPVRSDGFGRY